MICPFTTCIISGMEQEPIECPFAIKDEEGNSDCGYG